MKMETSLTAPFRGASGACWPARTSRSCGAGAAAADRAARDGASRRTAAGERVRAAPRAEPAPTHRRALPDDLRTARVARARLRHRRRRGATRPRRPARRLRRPLVRPGADPRRAPLLGLYADLRALTRPRHDEDDPDARAARQPAGAPARLPALARRRRPSGCPALRRRAGARARPLRRRRASTARRRSRRPATASSSARSAPSARARRCSRSSTGGSSSPPTSPASATSSATCSTASSRDRGGPRPGRRRPRPRGPLPLLRRAGHRGGARARTPRWRPTSPRSPPTRTRADRGERIAALVACPRRSRRC